MNLRKKEQPYTSQLRGVAALLGELSPTEGIQTVALQAIKRPIEQPRRYFDPSQMQQLVDSVREHGILEPLLVRPLSTEEYELVAGERRYRAAVKVGLAEVPVVIKQLSDEEALQLALVENLQRVDLNPVEETEGILKLLAIRLTVPLEQVPPLLYRLQNEKRSRLATNNVIGEAEVEIVSDVFRSLGRMELDSFISNRLPLLRIPTDVLEELRQGAIEYTKALAIAKVKDDSWRQSILAEAIDDSLSLTQIRQKIKAIQSQSDQSQSEPNSPQSTIRSVTRQITKSKVWENPTKWKKAKALLKQLEDLVQEE